MQPADRLRRVPLYLFAELDRKKAEAQKRGVDIISLGIGDPDQPTPPWVIERLQREAEQRSNHRYPDYIGLKSFRDDLANYYQHRFGVQLDPVREVMTLIGSKEGISHLAWAYLDPGDIALVPDPAYPVYLAQTLLAGGEPHLMPLRPEHGFLPDYRDIPSDVAKKAKLLFINYPCNPTGAVADLPFFEETIAFAKEYDILVAHDAAYVEMTFGGLRAPSILQVPGAKERAVEFYSLSKPFNMTGWRLGAMVGNAEAVAALGIVKTNTDSGQFNAIQEAGREALSHDPEAFFAEMNQIYTHRRDLLVEGLRHMGWQLEAPKGTFYLWIPVPKGWTDAGICEVLLEQAGIIVAPGSAYGKYGSGFIRMTLTLEEERIREALGRMAKLRLFDLKPR